ncbi:zinc-binding protein [Methanobrevibacter sp. YE315]|uniref:zinc ribbon domain-containing protein n=1 Tax=Methanobrevibacter sp. YE315 TaxID=1609968 RepID=UPI000764D52C|nr:zinc ribbon domain-containing protein [Methanobrevibacter sp. YE315]AMD18081.1 zinc-binding protein [Methanobrevibacter sp. YE315]
MVLRRCPQCGSTSDDIYGFCIKCGYEFTKIEAAKNACPLCGFSNPDEADFCVKCGTPLIFKNQKGINPVIIRKESINNSSLEKPSRMNTWLILFGYIFSILGGILGLIIAIYLSTRKDPTTKKHGHIQLAIFGFYIILIGILFATGNIPAEAFTNYSQMLAGNFTFP